MFKTIPTCVRSASQWESETWNIRETKTIVFNVAESFGYGTEKVTLIFTSYIIETLTQLEQGISGVTVDQTWMLKQ